MLMRALGLKENKEAALFSDVSINDWYAGAIGAAAKTGIITGYPGGRFGPGDKISSRQSQWKLRFRRFRNACRDCCHNEPSPAKSAFT
jgi:hypothetical protein